MRHRCGRDCRGAGDLRGLGKHGGGKKALTKTVVFGKSWKRHVGEVGAGALDATAAASHTASIGQRDRREREGPLTTQPLITTVKVQIPENAAISGLSTPQDDSFRYGARSFGSGGRGGTLPQPRNPPLPPPTPQHTHTAFSRAHPTILTESTSITHTSHCGILPTRMHRRGRISHGGGRGGTSACCAPSKGWILGWWLMSTSSLTTSLLSHFRQNQDVLGCGRIRAAPRHAGGLGQADRERQGPS